MDCKRFVSLYTDFRDGRLSDAERTSCRVHLSECPSCARYHRVVEEGVRTLKAAETPGVGADFLPRLQHRIYHVEDGDVLQGGARASGATAVATIGLAVILAAAAWSPVLRQAPTVRLPALVVTGPPETRADPRLPSSAFFRASDQASRPVRRGAPNLTWSPPRPSLASPARTVTSAQWSWTASPSFRTIRIRRAVEGGESLDLETDGSPLLHSVDSSGSFSGLD